MTVRNKKRVSYTYELTLRVKGGLAFHFLGLVLPTCFYFSSYFVHWFDVSILNNIITESGEWLAGEEKKKVKGYVDIPEFSVGELNDLQVHYIANSKAHLRLTSKSSEHIEMERFPALLFANKCLALQN